MKLAGQVALLVRDNVDLIRKSVDKSQPEKLMLKYDL